MKIEQLYFTRTEGEGWKVVNITEGVTEDIKRAFNTVHTQTPSNKTLYSLDFSENKHFLSKVTASGKDNFGREKCFIHCYVFSEADVNDIFTDGTRLLSINSFKESEAAGIEPVSELPANGYKSAVAFDGEKRFNLVRGIYEALLDSKALFVYHPDSEVNDMLIKSVVCTAYAYLPLALRKFVTFSSGEGGIIRRITVTNTDEPKAGMVYNFASGQVSGCSGKYDDFISTMLTDAPLYLGKIQEYIEKAGAAATLNADLYSKAMSFVMASSSGDDSSMSDDEVKNELLKLTGDKLYNPSDASYCAMLVGKVIKNGIDIPKILHNMIVEAYHNTNSAELKNAIANYMSYSFGLGCSDEDFASFRTFKVTDRELYKTVSVATIKSNAADFVRCFSKAVLSGSDDSAFITGECGEECARIVASDAVKYITASERGAELIGRTLGLTLHKAIVDGVVYANADNAIIWAYLDCAFATPETYGAFAALETRNNLGVFLAEHCMEAPERTVAILRKLYSSNRAAYKSLENLFVKREKLEILDMFYAASLVPACAASTEKLLELQSAFYGISNVRNRFNEAIFVRFMECAKNECSDLESATASVERTDRFATALGKNAQAYRLQIKEHFWNGFSFKTWNADGDYSGLFVRDNVNSDTVELLGHITRILKMQEPEDERYIGGAIMALCSSEDIKEPSVRDQIIKKLKAKFISGSDVLRGQKGSRDDSRNFDMNIDLYLLMHFSNESDNIEGLERFPYANKLCDYVNECMNSYEQKHMIINENVLVSLYKAVHATGSAGANHEALSLLAQYAENFYNDKNAKRLVQKEIKKLSTIKDFTYIGFFAIIAAIVFMFRFVGGLGLPQVAEWLAKGGIALLGVFAVGTECVFDYRNESGMGGLVGLLSQFVSGISLLAALLVSVSVLF